MGKYDFDTVANRFNTYSMKYDFMKTRYPEGFIPLFVADMDLKCAPQIVKAMHRVADHELYGYSAPMADYYEAVQGWFKRRYNWEIEKDWILPSSGTCSGINYAIEEFSQLKDGVIITRPVYGHFTGMIEDDTNRTAVDAHLYLDDEGVWRMDFDQIEKYAQDPKNRIFLLCSPHNPVGRVWEEWELKKIIEITKKNNMLLIVDEIHCDLVRADQKFVSVGTLTDDYSNIIIAGGLGKTFNIAGLHASNIIIPDPYLRARFRMRAGMGGFTPFTIAAIISAYTECDDWVDELNEYLDGNIELAMSFFAEKMPWVKISRPQGTYCLWIDFEGCGLSGEEIHKRIYEDANVILQDGTVHDPKFGSCCQRMCVPVARSVLKEALERIEKVFADIK